jgi:hypothetical protein
MCRMPIFANAEEIKPAEDVNKPIVQLEFGRELEYFRSRSGAPTPGPVLQGTGDDGLHSAGWQRAVIPIHRGESDSGRKTGLPLTSTDGPCGVGAPARRDGR